VKRLDKYDIYTDQLYHTGNSSSDR